MGAIKKASGQPPVGREERYLRLLDVARFMGVEKHLDPLLAYITTAGMDALNAARCSLFLLDEDRGEIWSRVALGEENTIRFPMGTGIAGSTIGENRIINITDAYKDTRFNRRIDEQTGFRTENILSVPLCNTDGKAIGCFQAINKTGGGAFDGEDEDFASAFAAQAAVAIESALLYEQRTVFIRDLQETRDQLQKKVSQIEVMSAIEKEVHSDQPITRFLEKVTALIAGAMESEASTILVPMSASQWLEFGYRSTGGNESPYESARIEPDEVFQKYVAGLYQGVVTCQPNPGTYRIWPSDRSKNWPFSVFVPFHFRMPSGSQEGEDIVDKTGYFCLNFTKATILPREDMEFLAVLSGNIATVIEMRLLNDEREKSKRLSTIGQLSSSIFHDFRNPLTTIRSAGELLHMMAVKPNKERLEKYSQVIMTQVDRCVGMMEELLAFTRGEQNLNFESHQLSHILKEVEEALSVEVERSGIRLQVNLHKEQELKCDKDRLLRVVFNLTNNAFQVLEKGDEIRIDGGEEKDGRVLIRITDNGPGIPAAVRNSLFEIFVTHGKKNGTGLGLHISRTIATKHGGSLYLDESVSTGASFVMELDRDPSE